MQNNYLNDTIGEVTAQRVNEITDTHLKQFLGSIDLGNGWLVNVGDYRIPVSDLAFQQNFTPARETV